MTDIWRLYVAEFPHGKLYFGITSKALEERISSHRCATMKRKTIFQKAMLKYGGGVIFRTLVVGYPDYIRDLEIRAIAKFHTRDPMLGYNVALGGELSPSLVPEIVERHASKRRGISVQVSQASLDALMRASQDPEVLKQRSELFKKLHTDPEFKAAHSARLKKRWDDEEFRKRHADSVTAAFKKPEIRAAHKDSLDKLHDRPGWREGRSEFMNNLHANPGFKQEHSKRQSNRWHAMHADPEFAAATKARAIAMNADPVFKEATRQRMRDRWKNPEFQSFMKAVHARRKKPKTPSNDLSIPL